MAGLYAPLPTLRSHPRGGLHPDRGRRGLLLLHRSGLSPHTPCRSPGALTRVAACTLARSPLRDPLSEGFRHFVSSMPAPIASGWSESPGGPRTHWKSAALSRRTPLTAVGLEPSKRGREFDLVFFASCAAQPTQCQTRDSCRCLVRDREHRADVDLAQDVAVFARRGARSIEKVGVPDDRQRAGLDAQHLDLPPEKWTPGYADFASARSGVM